MAAAAASPRSVAMLVHTLDDRAVARVVLAVAAEIARAGTKVTVICVTRAREHALPVPEGVRIHDLGLRRLPTSLAAPRLARELRRTRPEVLFAHLDGPARAALLAREMAGSTTAVVVVEHTHHGTFYRGRRLLKDRLAGWLFGRAELVAGTSPGAVADLETRFPRVRGSTLVLPSVSPDEGAVRRAHGELPDHPWYRDPGGGPIVCCVANLVPRKGQDALIEALPLLKTARPARLMLVGRPDDPAFVAALRRRAEQLGLSGRVSFAGYHADALPWIAHADVLALASHTEGFGMVLVEAMACGVPVVAVDCPAGPRWVLDGGRLGWLVPPGDIIALADALGAALSDEARRREVAAAARQRAAGFRPDAVAASYLAAAARALDVRRRRAAARRMPSTRVPPAPSPRGP